jgi:hypothetical protein
MAETPVAIAIQPIVVVEKLLVVIGFSLSSGLRYWQVGGRGLCLGAEKTQSQLFLADRPGKAAQGARRQRVENICSFRVSLLEYNTSILFSDQSPDIWFYPSLRRIL